MECRFLRDHDRIFLRDFHVRHGQADPGAAHFRWRFYSLRAAAQLDFPFLHFSFRRYCAGLHFAGRPDQRHLQRSAAILFNRRRIYAAGLDWTEERGRLARHSARFGSGVYTLLARHGPRQHQSAGHGMVRAGVWSGLRSFVWILVYRFPGDSERDGCRIALGCATRAADRIHSKNVFSFSGDLARL